MIARITQKFAKTKAEGRTALITYIMGGDPDYETSLALMNSLPTAGADFIEFGIPFSDPMADGPVIQAAGLRALKNGHNLKKSFKIIREFRQNDSLTPVIFMGYYNPVYVYGIERFLQDAQTAGVDGLLIVDLPPEMDEELCLPARRIGISFIRFIAPTTNEARLTNILKNSSGFLYYISMTGITGQTLDNPERIDLALSTIRKQTSLPIAVGFGIKSREDKTVIEKTADAIVIGTAIVDTLAKTLDIDGKAGDTSLKAVCDFVSSLL